MRRLGTIPMCVALAAPLLAEEPAQSAGTPSKYADRIRVVRRYRAPADKAAMREKLRTIVIPKIRFEDLTVEEAILYLRKRARELDPDGVGVNFVLLTPERKKRPEPDWSRDAFGPLGKDFEWGEPTAQPSEPRR